MNYTTKDHFKLHKHEWAIASPKAKILIVHGLAEHGGRYTDLALALNQSGYSVVAFDSRGSGRSDGLVAHIDSFNQLTEDLDMVAKAEYVEGLPYVLLSHSLGGLISSRYLIDYKDHPFDFAVFSAPAVKPDDNMAPLLRKVAGIASALFPKWPAAALPQNFLSRDPLVLQKYQEDPLIYKGKVRARKGHEIMKSMAYVADKFNKISIPVLIMHGSDDRVTDPIGSQMLYDGASSTDKTLRYYKGLWHEIFNEPEKETVITDTIDWLNERIKSL